MPEQKPSIHKKQGSGVVCEETRPDEEQNRTNTAFSVGVLDKTEPENKTNKALFVSADKTGWEEDTPQKCL